MKTYYQQGDVLITKITDFNASSATKLDHLILAEGEVTGHAHKLTDGIGQLMMLDNIVHLKIFSDKATITHDEHAPIIVPKGDYKINIVREYDHFNEESTRVRD